MDKFLNGIVIPAAHLDTSHEMPSWWWQDQMGRGSKELSLQSSLWQVKYRQHLLIKLKTIFNFHHWPPELLSLLKLNEIKTKWLLPATSFLIITFIRETTPPLTFKYLNNCQGQPYLFHLNGLAEEALVVNSHYCSRLSRNFRYHYLTFAQRR